MLWFLFLQLVFGFLFAHRTASDSVRRNLLTETSAKQIKLCAFLLLFVLLVWLRQHSWLALGAFLGCCALLVGLPNYLLYRLRNVIQSEFPGFVDRLILSMKTGHSFRAAVDRTLDQPTEIWQKWLRSMIDSRVFLPSETSDENRKWWSPWLRELQTVQKNPHSALARLVSLRRKMQVLSEFRRKSGQALLQARIQMAVMTVLYFALLLLTMQQFPVAKYLRLISLSVVLFSAGLLLFWRLARKRSWKV